ncbi:transglycosylase domain-containing protein [Candidatus Uhrbacteria bacterium]|nr:transglycosylase domain-containing protein [Candidatus Uhrbacteria bacterium]
MMQRWSLGRVSRVLFAVVGMIMAVAFGACIALSVYAWRQLPSLDAISMDRLPQDVLVLDRQNHRIDSQKLEENGVHRVVIPYGAIHQHIIDAVIATEDSRFWQHEGMDWYGALRAGVATLRDPDHIQGGSTISQQILKLSVLQGQHRVIRKLEEAMLAGALEARFTKKELLGLYLNTVDLGEGNAGVESAARELFGKSAATVSLPEAAVLVGKIQAPERFSPFCAYQKTRERQQHVLHRLAVVGNITAAEERAALRAPVAFALGDATPDATQVASVVDAAFREQAYASGDRVVTSVDLQLQTRAVQALRASLQEYAMRSGEHRGPRTVLPNHGRAWRQSLDAFRAALRAWGTAPQALLVYDLRMISWATASDRAACAFGATIFRPALPNGIATGIVTAVDRERAVLDLGDLHATIAAKSITWTGKSITAIMPRGAVVDITLPATLPKTAGATVAVTLVPRPVAEGAVIVLVPATGAIRAIVGGAEMRHGDRNRAIDARRPIGSTVKPFVIASGFALGLFQGDDPVEDSPIEFIDPETFRRWTPRNWYRGYAGPMRLSDAMARSVNAVAAATTLRVGIDRVALFIEELAPGDPIRRLPASGLGAFDRAPMELATAFAAFAHAGNVPAWSAVDRVQQSDGVQVRSPQSVAVLDPGFAKMIDAFLAQPVAHPAGTAHRLAKLGLGLRGKTGTTNDAKDAWFVGYHPDLLVAVWVGYDEPRSLQHRGVTEGGASLAVPVAEAVFAAAAEFGWIRPAPVPAPTVTWSTPFGPDASARLPHAFALRQQRSIAPWTDEEEEE